MFYYLSAVVVCWCSIPISMIIALKKSVSFCYAAVAGSVTVGPVNRFTIPVGWLKSVLPEIVMLSYFLLVFCVVTLHF